MYLFADVNLISYVGLPYNQALDETAYVNEISAYLVRRITYF